MVRLAQVLAFASLLYSSSVFATPLEYERSLEVPSSDLNLHHRRQDSSDDVAAEDEDDAQIAADGTKPLRSAVPARALYVGQATASWSQISTAVQVSDAAFTVFTTTAPKASPAPPTDKNQVIGQNNWDVDHIFELQVIGQAFKEPRPNNIPAADWASATNAVFTQGAQCTNIAQQVTVLENLEGIPSAPNSFKKQVFTGNLTGKGFPSNGDTARYFNYFGPAVQKVLKDNQDSLMAGVVDNTGDALASAGGNNNAIKAYFTSYASFHYQGAIDFLSTWEGKPLPASTTSSSASSIQPSASATAAAVSCTHEADPQNTCSAVADSKGWCQCGDSTATYAIMPASASNPCGWTTTPPTTAFACGATAALNATAAVATTTK